jgi:Protein of unknown function (DUF2950)
MTTFLVNDRGNIYEKDLGSRTAAIASGMTSFDRHLAAGDPSGSVPDCAALGIINTLSRANRKTFTHFQTYRFWLRIILPFPTNSAHKRSG